MDIHLNLNVRGMNPSPTLAINAQCERLRQEFANDLRIPPIPLRIVAIPELIHLLSPPAIAPSARAQQ